MQVHHRAPSARCSGRRTVRVQAPGRSVLARPVAHRPRHVACASTADAAPDASPARISSTEAWQRLELVQRQLEIAVKEEDFGLAAKLRDECKVLQASLSPIQQYLFAQAATLRSGQLSEKLQAIRAFAETGDQVVIPELAMCLSDPELVDFAEHAMWSIFMRCPDPAVSDMMKEACSIMDNPMAYDRSLAMFDQVTQLAPDYAEGYNKRATLLYMMKRFEDSIKDCKKVLKLQPYHFGAASGMGLCYLMLNKDAEAADAFEQALQIHPGLGNISRVLKEIKRRAASGGKDAAGEA